MVTMGRTLTALGSTVGQLLPVDIGTSAADQSTLQSTRFVPEARTVSFTATDDSFAPGYITRDTRSESWYAHPFSGSPSYAFTAGVASLRTGLTIESYFNYHQQPTPQAYFHGLLIRTDGNVDLGSDRIMFAIEKQGFQYSNPEVDLIHNTDEVGTGAQLTIAGEVGDFLYVAVEGVLLEGDTLLLVRAASGPYNPPGGTIVTPGSGAGSGSGSGSGGGGGLSFGPASSASQPATAAPVAIPATFMSPRAPMLATVAPVTMFDEPACTPPTPNANLCPDPPAAPTPEHDCGVRLIGHPSVASDIVPRGEVECNGVGQSTSSEECTEYSGGLEFKFSIKLFGSEITIGGHGEVSHKECDSSSTAACTCTGKWMCDWHRVSHWKKCNSYTVWIEWFTWEKRQHWVRLDTAISGVNHLSDTTCQATGGGC